jgi:hypothetical protein
MSRQSPTKAQAKITELWWEPTIATAAARSGTDETGLYRPLIERSLEVALERCRVGSQGRPERDVPNFPISGAMNRASSRKEATRPHLTRCRFGCRVDGVSNGR